MISLQDKVVIITGGGRGSTTTECHWNEAITYQVYRHNRSLCYTSKDTCVIQLTLLRLLLILILLLTEDKATNPAD